MTKEEGLQFLTREFISIDNQLRFTFDSITSGYGTIYVYDAKNKRTMSGHWRFIEDEKGLFIEVNSIEFDLTGLPFNILQNMNSLEDYLTTRIRSSDIQPKG